MLYAGDRHYGCRFLEVTLYGMRTLMLENELLRVTLLLDKGTDIVSFLHKPTDVDFAWHNPMGLSCLRKIAAFPPDADALSDNYPGGFFEILPNVGGPCHFAGKSYPGNGEVAYLPWEYQVERDTPEELCLRFFVRLSKLPLRLEKTLTLKSGVPSVFVEETLHNLGETPVAFQWGHHPNLGAPFLDGGCLIDLPGGAVEVIAGGERVAAGDTGVWPAVRSAGGQVDFSRMPSPGSMTNELLHVELTAPWAAVRSPHTGMGIGFAWNGAAFPSAALWMSAGHLTGHHHHGGAYVLCILPKNTRTMGLSAAGEAGEAPLLPGGGSAETFLTITAFPASGPVNTVRRDGTVVV